MLQELAVPGTHDFVLALVCHHVSPPGRILDLGAGTGALAERLHALGFDLLAVDNDDDLYVASTPFRHVDLNVRNFYQDLSYDFDVVTAVDVIEHLENPVAFLRGIGHCLKPDGIAVVTTPNVENVPARLKFLFTGKLRMMDANAPWHITPIFYDLFVRQYLPMTGLKLVKHAVYPPDDYPQTAARWLIPVFKMATYLLGGPALAGDTHVFVLQHTE